MNDICEQCFLESDNISEYIQQQGIKQNEKFTCRECEREESEYLISRYKLREKLQYIIHQIYAHEDQHGLHGSFDMGGLGSPCSDLYEVCEDLFGFADESLVNLLCEHDNTDGHFESPYYTVWVDIPVDWEGTEHHDLKWKEFCELVKYKARFFDHERADRLTTLKKLESIFSKFTRSFIDQNLYRARKIRNDESLAKITSNPSNELGRVPKELAGYNRFSPSGISYIYLADNKLTASKEIENKGKGAIAIGEFKLDSGLKIIEFSHEYLNRVAHDYFDEEFCPEVRATSAYLKEFINEISKPISESDKFIDYVPTQIVSEFIWSLGYDGFTFPSSQSKGTNFVLFGEKYDFIAWEKLASD